MVYGILTLSIHKKLTLPQAFVAYAALCVLLFGCVRLKNRIMSARGPSLGVARAEGRVG
jgi:hypothetical protein